MGKKIQSQHIISLKASNVKRLTAVRIQLEKRNGSVILSGANSAGKSSVLDAIVMTLRGKSAVPGKPIRNGAEKAEVVLETEDLIVKRRFTAKDTYLEVLNRDGAKYGKPQDILDSLVSAIGFDPLKFSQMDLKAQSAELLRVCPIKLDLAKNALDAKAAEDERRDANRDMKRLEAQLQGMRIPPPNTPKEEVSVSELSSKLVQLQEDANETASLRASADSKVGRIAEIDKQLQQLKEERERHSAQIEDYRKRVAEAPDHDAQIKEIRAQIGKSEETNAAVRARLARERADKECDAAKERAEKLDAKVSEIRQQRADALAAAKFPVPGLSLDADGKVVFNGVPLDQCSTSEQIKVGVALAVSANPILRVIFIKDGSLLDKASMEQLEKLAEENDLQIWMERVEDNSPAAIQIHDGTNLDTPPEEDASKAEAVSEDEEDLFDKK